jgi:hypothetical protein
VFVLLVSLLFRAGLQMAESGLIQTILWRLDPMYYVRDSSVPPIDTPLSAEEDVIDPRQHYELMDNCGHLLWLLLTVFTECVDVHVPTPTQQALWSVFH